MNTTPVSDARALRTAAENFDALRGKLPFPGDPHRGPDSVSVAKQISELGKRITALGDEILIRTVSPDLDAHTARVISDFAAAVEPAGRWHPRSARWPTSSPSWSEPSTCATSPTRWMRANRPRW